MLKFNLIYFVLTAYFNLPVVTGGGICNSNSGKPKSELIKDHILCDYDKSIRPVTEHNSSIPVDISFLIQHFDFSEHGTTIDVSLFMGMRWNDEHLSWNPEEYDGVDLIYLKSDDIWTPDMSIYNRGGYSDSLLMDDTAECHIFYYKKVMCITSVTIYGTCWPNLKYWPFDVQNCSLRIGSWFHTGEEVDLNGTTYIEDNLLFRENPEWNLQSVQILKHPGKFPCCPSDTYPYLIINFVINRHYSAKFAFIVLPYLVLILMTIITLWLDPTSSERIYITSISIPCHLMFLLNSVWEVPETADTIPYLLLFLRGSLIIASLSLIETLIVRCLFEKTTETPRWLVRSFSLLTNNPIGQLFIFSDLDPEHAVANLTNEDSSTLVEVKENPKEWYLLGRIIDRLSFATVIGYAVIMFFICIPK